MEEKMFQIEGELTDKAQLSDVKSALKAFDALKKKYPSTFKLLTKLAFALSTDKDGRHIATSDELESHKIQLEEAGILRYVDSGEAMFMHKTFQEFFAAYHLYLALLKGIESEECKSAIKFIRTHKYQSRYEMELTFLVGLVFRETCEEPSKRAQSVLWDTLFSIERDLIGPHHCQLLIRSLEESGRDDKVHIVELVEWLETSLSEDSLSEMLRQRLREAFEKCPRTTQNVFQAYQKELGAKNIQALWLKLAGSQRQALLQDYWLPLLSHFEEVPSLLLCLLADEKLPIEQLQIVLNVDWREAKNSRQRQQLSEQLSKHVMNLAGDQQLVCFQVWCALLTEEDTFATDVINSIEGKLGNDQLVWCALFVAAVLEPNHQLDVLAMLCEQVIAEDEFASTLLTYARDWEDGKELKIDTWLKCLNGKNVRLRELAIKELSGLLQKNDKGYKELQTCLLGQASLDIKGEKPPLWSERVDMLLDALDSREVGIRKMAIQIAGSMKLKCPMKVIDKLCEVMRIDPDATLRTSVIDVLSHVDIEYHRMISLLLAGLSDEGENVCSTAAYALGRVGGEDGRVIPALLRMLRRDKNACEIAVRTLGELGDVGYRAIHALEKVLHHDDRSIRVKAAHVLGRVSYEVPSRVLEVLSDSVTWNDYESVREEAVEALGQVVNANPEEVLSLLSTALRDKEEFVRRKAVEVLGQVIDADPPEVISLLLVACKDLDSFVRLKAVQVLGEVGGADDRVIPALLKSLRDEHEYFRDMVLNALVQVCGVDPILVVPAVLKALKREKRSTRREVIDDLRQVGGAQMTRALLKSLKDKDKFVRKAAAEILEWQVDGANPGIMIPAHLKAVIDKDKRVPEKSVLALRRVEGMRGREIPALLDLLNDEDDYVRREAFVALGRVGGADSTLVIETLLTMLKQKEEAVRLEREILAKSYLSSPAEIVSFILEQLRVSRDWGIGCHFQALCFLRGKIISDPVRMIPALMQALPYEDKFIREEVFDLIRACETEIQYSLVIVGYNFARRVVVPAIKALFFGEEPNIEIPVQMTAEEELLEFRCFGIETLRQVCVAGDPAQVAPALLKALDDEDNNVREMVADAIGPMIGTAPLRLLPVLLKLLENQEDYVFNSVITKLRKQGSKFAPDALTELTHELAKVLDRNSNSSPELQVSALVALKALYTNISISSWFCDFFKERYLQCNEDVVRTHYLHFIANPLLSTHYTHSRICTQQTMTIILQALIEFGDNAELFYQKLSAFQCTDPHEFIIYLVSTIDQLQLSPERAATIFQTLSIPLVRLLNAIIDREKQSDTLCLALAEYWLHNGADLQRLGRDALESSILNKRLTHRVFTHAFSKALQERLDAHGWPHRRIDCHVESQAPRYWQKSRHTFYTCMDSLPFIPLVTHNQAYVAGKSLSLQKRIDAIFDFQEWEHDGFEEHYFTVKKNGDAMRIRIKKVPCYFLLAKDEEFPIDPSPDAFYFKWEYSTISLGEYGVSSRRCGLKFLGGNEAGILDLKLVGKSELRKFLGWICAIPEPEKGMQNLDIKYCLHIDFLAALKLISPATRIMESITDMIVKKGCRMLDLSNNNLDDKSIAPLIECLLEYDKLNVLKLSHNRITCNGFNQLIKSLEGSPSPSVKYLLLDHNLIHFGPRYCDRLLRKVTGLVHLDLSMNFIPDGQLIYGRERVKKTTLAPFNEKDRAYHAIMNNLRVHSQYHNPGSSIIAPKLTIKVEGSDDDNEVVVLFSYRSKIMKSVSFGHSFLVIERIIPGFGQRQLIRAELVYESKEDKIIIKQKVISPEEFYEKVGGESFKNVFGHAVTPTPEKIDKLLEVIDSSRRLGNFIKYQTIPSSEKHVVNCHKWAVQQLCDAEIISDSHRGEWFGKEDRKLAGQVVYENTMGRFS